MVGDSEIESRFIHRPRDLPAEDGLTASENDVDGIGPCDLAAAIGSLAPL